MKKTAILPTLFLAFIIATLNSCTKTGPAGPQGNTGATGPNLSGTLQGYVQLYDQYGYRIYTPQDSSLLQVGTNSIRTDLNGKYSLTLTTGTYDINITSRPGGNYGASKIQGLQFTGGGTLDRDAALSQVPTFSVISVTAKDTAFPAANPVHYIKITGTVNSTDTKPRTVGVFFNTTANVSSVPANYLYAYDPTNPVVAANSTTFSFNVKSQNIYLMTDLVPTQTVYLAVYPAAVNWNSTSNYLDYASDKKIYTAIGSTPVNASAVMQ